MVYSSGLELWTPTDENNPDDVLVPVYFTSNHISTTINLERVTRNFAVRRAAEMAMALVRRQGRTNRAAMWIRDNEQKDIILRQTIPLQCDPDKVSKRALTIVTGRLYRTVTKKPPYLRIEDHNHKGPNPPATAVVPFTVETPLSPSEPGFTLVEITDLLAGWLNRDPDSNEYFPTFGYDVTGLGLPHTTETPQNPPLDPAIAKSIDKKYP